MIETTTLFKITKDIRWIENIRQKWYHENPKGRNEPNSTSKNEKVS